MPKYFPVNSHSSHKEVPTLHHHHDDDDDVYYIDWNFVPEVITCMWSLSPLLRIKIVHLVNRSDLFTISNLVYGGKEIVRSLSSSLQGQRFMVGIVS